MTIDEARAELRSRRTTKGRLLERLHRLDRRALAGFLTEDEKRLRAETQARVRDITQAIREARADLRAAIREAKAP